MPIIRTDKGRTHVQLHREGTSRTSRKVRRKGSGNAKGASFERALCKQLSLWWSGGESDDHFYRSPQSGGRATTRSKKGQFSSEVGDIRASTEFGRKFTDLITVEAKVGYPNLNLQHAVFDNPKSEFWDWVEQAIAAANRANRWWLIWKQDRRTTVLFLHHLVSQELGLTLPQMLLYSPRTGTIAAFDIEYFLAIVSPDRLQEKFA